jgi:DHA2 family multidrug resistance protein
LTRPEQKASSTDWIAVAAGSIGSFMASLDSSVVNASLPTIQGEIGANQSEGTWITTAYLVSEIIMITLAGWLDRILGLRNFLIICTAAFTAFSVWSGLSHSLEVMILGRLGQGFTGGAMVPTALTIVARRLPLSQRSIGISLFGATVVLGPVVGPLLGGYLTENFSWRYAFFINVPIGITLLILLVIGLPATKMKLSALRDADLLGIGGLALGLGSLTTLLEEGQQDRWFESQLIDWLCVASVIGFIMLAVGQLTARKPVINLQILFQRAFGGVFVMSLFVGAALYGIGYMLPQFLASLSDYNAEQNGEVTLISGIPTTAMMFVFPLLVKILDIRLAIGIGLLLYGVSCFMNTGLTEQTSGVDFVLPQIVAGFGQFFSMVFLNQAATDSVTRERVDDASGLFNAARNLGGSMGLAAISTLREQRTTFHTERLAETITSNAVRSQDYVAQATARLGMGDPVAGLQRMYASLGAVLSRAATAMAFSDIFLVFGLGLILVIPLVLLLKVQTRDKPPSAG